METEEEMEEVFYLCRFDPEPAEAVTYYLPRLLPGSPPPPPPLPRGIDRLIHRADVYARSPADLAASFPPAPKAESTGDRFFLTPRRRIPGRRGSRSARVAGEGTWVTQKTREIREDGAKVGELRSLSFKKGGKRTPPPPRAGSWRSTAACCPRPPSPAARWCSARSTSPATPPPPRARNPPRICCIVKNKNKQSP